MLQHEDLSQACDCIDAEPVKHILFLNNNSLFYLLREFEKKKRITESVCERDKERQIEKYTESMCYCGVQNEGDNRNLWKLKHLSCRK